MIQVENTTVTQVRIITTVGIETSITEVSQEIIMEIENLLETEAKAMAILVETREVEAEVEAEVEVDLTQASISGDRE